MESIRLFVNAYVAVDGEPFYNNIRMSKHTDLIDECIMYYIYTYHLRCPKQDVLRTLIRFSMRTPPKPAYILVCVASKAASMLLLARYLAEF